jgi:uncharacterized membrane protein YqjE
MTVMVKELRDALIEAGASPEKADAAAAAVLERQEALDRLATKTDLAELKADIFRLLMVHGLAIVVATVSLVKLLPGSH